MLKSPVMTKNMQSPESDIFTLADKYSGYTDLDTTDSSSDLLIDTDPDSHFMAEFYDGYVFRMLIEYLRDTNTSGNFIITEEGISYTQCDGEERLLNDIFIYGHELTKFRFHSKTGKIIIGADIDDLRQKAKSIRKKFGVTLYKEPGQDFLCMQIHGQTSTGSSGNIIMIKPEHVSLTKADLPIYKNPETKPNCIIAIETFFEHCSLLKDASAGKVTVSGYPEGMVMIGRTEDGSIGKISDFGDLPEKREDSKIVSNIDISGLTITEADVTPTFIVQEDIPIAPDAIHSITIDVATVKALSKLNNITPRGTVKVYFERKKPIKFICHIGTFGKLTIILMGIENPGNFLPLTSNLDDYKYI